MLKQKKIVVVMGGPSTEAEVSRRTGTAILNALKKKGYNAEGMELDPQNFAEQIKKSGCDIVFNALHGKYGEDGSLQGTLDMLDIPYTGSGLLSAATTMDKVTAKKIFAAEKISTPRFRFYNKSCDIRAAVDETKKNFSLPVVIKASAQGSSIGVYIVSDKDELAKAFADAFGYNDEVLVEEFIKGRELTVAVWGDAAKAEAMPVIEITTVSGRYDYDSKYTAGASTHIVPAELSAEKTDEVQALAVKTFRAFGCRGVARVDMMFAEDETPYVIEVNSVPGMTATSLVPDAARAMGVDFPDLCERMLLMVEK